jgi:hypothetical protein
MKNTSFRYFYFMRPAGIPLILPAFAARGEKTGAPFSVRAPFIQLTMSS